MELPLLYKHEFDFTENDFRVIQKLIYDHAGISLNDAKQNLVYSRLSRRLRANNLKNFSKPYDSLPLKTSEKRLF